MKIFLVSNMYPSKKNPLFGVFVKNFKDEMQSQGVIFSATSLIKGKKKSFLEKAIAYSIHYLTILFMVLFKKFDLLYVHYISLHLPILFFFGALKKPVIINLHGSDAFDIKESKMLTTLAKPVFKKAAMIVVPTYYFKSLVLEQFDHVDSSKIFVSPSGGIDEKLFFPVKSQIGNLNTVSLGFISRFIEEKGWRIFLDSLSLLHQKKIAFNAIIAGHGPDEQKLKDYAKNKGLSKFLTFLGLIDQRKLGKIYNKMNLYVFPTYREAESLGLTGLEAMACGIPNIASNMAGPSTYIKHGQNGFLFKPKNAEALAEQIINYLEMSVEKRKELSDNAIRTASEYSRVNVAKKLKDKLEELVD